MRGIGPGIIDVDLAARVPVGGEREADDGMRHRIGGCSLALEHAADILGAHHRMQRHRQPDQLALAADRHPSARDLSDDPALDRRRLQLGDAQIQLPGPDTGLIGLVDIPQAARHGALQRRGKIVEIGFQRQGEGGEFGLHLDAVLRMRRGAAAAIARAAGQREQQQRRSEPPAHSIPLVAQPEQGSRTAQRAIAFRRGPSGARCHAAGVTSVTAAHARAGAGSVAF
ncbi:hypothetical protein S2M10_11540 [Sphingomonas sp. S2M10]|nr:hypothetical protein [Sphingomonas sp. S2M10]